MMRFSCWIAALALAVPVTVSANDGDTDDRLIMVGIGAQMRPRFPGADRQQWLPLPVVNVWHKDRPMDVETPDENWGANIVESGTTKAGVTIAFAPRRRANDVPGLRAVKFGIEAGLFGETYVHRHIRLRAEARQGMGAHGGLTGDVAIDVVHRLPDRHQRSMITIGPRVRWSSAHYANRYWGVSTAESVASGLPIHRASGGVHAVGAVVGGHLSLSQRWGLYGFGGYDRLVGAAKNSPVVATQGNRNQWRAGVAVTHVFGLR